MPTSYFEAIPDLIAAVKAESPESVLDVGIGFGKYGLLLREVLDVAALRYRREDWHVRIDGVEAFYITHTEEQTRLACGDCERLGMLSTGSADFHGPGNRIFSRFRAFDTHGLTANLGPLAAA